MTDPIWDNELLAVQQENRHLKETIGALRERLEALRFEKEQSLGDAISMAAGEILQLRQTISALRNELEHQQVLCEETLFQREKTYGDQIDQLKDMVMALRIQLETKQSGD
ncbi:MAG: hypothetical protein KKF12_00625 [Proteobacteria bacterium]|nr:hypothetical protein [Desulfobacula sp.]MBU3954024.1 hypothetical protein [Pseudomonadota bacterium]MBU4129302.1 hypothetical protein [Pseudomonadota bacterium]